MLQKKTDMSSNYLQFGGSQWLFLQHKRHLIRTPAPLFLCIYLTSNAMRDEFL